MLNSCSSHLPARQPKQTVELQTHVRECKSLYIYKNTLPYYVSPCTGASFWLFTFGYFCAYIFGARLGWMYSSMMYIFAATLYAYGFFGSFDTWTWPNKRHSLKLIFTFLFGSQQTFSLFLRRNFVFLALFLLRSFYLLTAEHWHAHTCSAQFLGCL